LPETNAHLSLLFRVDGALCALPLTSIVEILRPLPVETLPEVPEFVVGLAVIRGEPVPVINLHAHTGSDLSATSRFVVLRVASRRVGLVVDEVVGLRALDHRRLGTLPELLSATADTIDAIGTLDGELLVVLNSARLVPEHVLALSDLRGIAS
jgi:purine-binding chemotaxis protein CheW